jgi:hypothetical protein
MLCPTDIFCGVNQQALAEAAARAGQPRHTGLPCTQGAATFCACTPGHNLMMGGASRVSADAERCDLVLSASANLRRSHAAIALFRVRPVEALSGIRQGQPA